MKCCNCRGFGWVQPNFKPCPCCHGRGRVLPTILAPGDTLKSVVVDALLTFVAAALALAALFGLLFL